MRIDLDERELDPTSYDLIVSLGSEFAAFDDHKPFVPREAHGEGRAGRRRCSGSASAVRCWPACWAARCPAAMSRRSGGCRCTTDPELVPEGPWFQWHFDNFTTPPGAT